MCETIYTYGVSIRLMTYNHELYIREAMDGIMMQKTDFKVELVIGDDFSDDKTLEIMKGYKDSENIDIKILNRKKGDNYWKTRQALGRLYNFSNILENCTGKYVALLDGDDYWIDPLKLQKQFDFMESHTECSVCFTAAKTLNEKYPQKSFIYRPKKSMQERTYSIEDSIIKTGNFMPTASIFFHQKYIKEIPEWVFSSPVGDMPLSLFLGTKGQYGYIDDVTCVYRVFATGSWNSQMNFEKRRKLVAGFLETLDAFNLYTNKRYNRIVQLEKARVKFNDIKSVVKRYVATSKFVSFLNKKLIKSANL